LGRIDKNSKFGKKPKRTNTTYFKYFQFRITPSLQTNTSNKHFKQEETTILDSALFPKYENDPERNLILQQHENTYKIIEVLSAPEKSQQEKKQNIELFFPLMFQHIKLEDKYFSRIKKNLKKELTDYSNRIEDSLMPNVIPILLGVMLIVFIIYFTRRE